MELLDALQHFPTLSRLPVLTRDVCRISCSSEGVLLIFRRGLGCVPSWKETMEMRRSLFFFFFTFCGEGGVNGVL